MSLRSYLFTMFLATLLAWGAWGWTITSIDPTRASTFGMFLFYTTLFVSLFGTFALVGFVIRFSVQRKVLAFRHVTIAFRQAASYAALVVGLLWLRSHGLLTWWNILIFIAALTVLEFFALSLRRQPPQ